MAKDKGPKSLREIVGENQDGFWNTRKLWRVLKGAKGSKKTVTTSLWQIYHMMKYPKANVLVVRKVFGTIQQSTFTSLKKAIYMLGVQDQWKITLSPLQMTYIPTGQVILFRGLDDAMKLAGLDVDTGVLCWAWFEETFEIAEWAEVEKLTWGFRGQLPPGYWWQFTCTFNPWSEHHWLKEKFFDTPRDDAFVETKTFRDNEFIKNMWPRYEALYTENPRAARVICDGDWGIAEGLIYNNWRKDVFDYREILKDPKVRTSFGLDFGYAVSFNAFIAILVDVEKRKLWVYDEWYEKGLSNIDIAKAITKLGYAKEEIWADSAEPKSIYELGAGFTEEVMDDDTGNVQLVHWQLPSIRPALKGPDSLMNGIQNLQSYEIIVHEKCINTIMELNNQCYDQDKDGKFLDKPIKDFDHLMDALRQGATKFFIKGRGYVCEAKGGVAPPPVAKKSRRVVSTL